MPGKPSAVGGHEGTGGGQVVPPHPCHQQRPPDVTHLYARTLVTTLATATRAPGGLARGADSPCSSTWEAGGDGDGEESANVGGEKLP